MVRGLCGKSSQLESTGAVLLAISLNTWMSDIALICLCIFWGAVDSLLIGLQSLCW